MERMSRTLGKILRHTLWNASLQTSMRFSALLVGSHALYAYTTQKVEEVKIVKKYKFDRNGDSIEDWHCIGANKSLYGKHYEWRWCLA